MAKRYKPNDFNKRCLIGMPETKTTQTGGKVKCISKDGQISVRYASKMRTISLQVQLSGTDKEDTFEIVIRHKPAINKKMSVEIDKALYSIVNISSDESANFERFDILTLKSKTKGV